MLTVGIDTPGTHLGWHRVIPGYEIVLHMECAYADTLHALPNADV
jgi:hypothetical protein